MNERESMMLLVRVLHGTTELGRLEISSSEKIEDELSIEQPEQPGTITVIKVEFTGDYGYEMWDISFNNRATPYDEPYKHTSVAVDMPIALNYCGPHCLVDVLCYNDESLFSS